MIQIKYLLMCLLEQRFENRLSSTFHVRSLVLPFDHRLALTSNPNKASNQIGLENPTYHIEKFLLTRTVYR